MEASHLREIKHIVANYSTRKTPSGYRRDSTSVTHKAILDLMKWRLIECEYTNGNYIFVRPVRQLFRRLTEKEKLQLGITK